VSEYTFHNEKFHLNYNELAEIYETHFNEMRDRLSLGGIFLDSFKPRLDEYFKASEGGWLKNYVVRTDAGEPIGYMNIYLTSHMKNHQFVANEDGLYIVKAHRKGVGKLLLKHVISDLTNLGVTQLNVSAMTDDRVVRMWQRLGFKFACTSMILNLQDK